MYCYIARLRLLFSVIHISEVFILPKEVENLIVENPGMLVNSPGSPCPFSCLA